MRAPGRLPPPAALAYWPAAELPADVAAARQAQQGQQRNAAGQEFP
jgi:hypothetical protein